MGVTFRTAGYTKFVRLGGRTIKDGEAAAIWNRGGVHAQVVGPRRVNLLFSTIRFLKRHKAESHQYLVIKHRNGRVDHMCGPKEMYENPAFHDEIRVEDAVLLKASQCIIVHNDGASTIRTAGMMNSNKSRSDDEASTVCTAGMNDLHEKEIVIPAASASSRARLFVPSPNEQVHSFSWSHIVGRKLLGPDPSSSFQVLSTSEQPMNISLKVRTADGFEVGADLHVEFDMTAPVGVETLLKFNDPIARIYHAFLADGRSIGDSLTVQMIRDGKHTDLDAIFCNKGTYKEGSKTAKECGFNIIAVRLTDLIIGRELKELITNEKDSANRTQMELQEKNQRREIHKLEMEDKRNSVEEEAELKRMKLASDDQLDRETHEMKLASLERKLVLEMHTAQAENEKAKMKDNDVLAFLENVKKLDVDMTKFLTSAAGSSDVLDTINIADFLKKRFVK